VLNTFTYITFVSSFFSEPAGRPDRRRSGDTHGRTALISAAKTRQTAASHRTSAVAVIELASGGRHATARCTAPTRAYARTSRPHRRRRAHQLHLSMRCVGVAMASFSCGLSLHVTQRLTHRPTDRSVFTRARARPGGPPILRGITRSQSVCVPLRVSHSIICKGSAHLHPVVSQFHA
jgi:hypothetical protein